MENIIETFSVTKQYRKQKAVNSISISIEQGAIYGLIGRNGAGKTTLMKMIAGLSAPTDGDIAVFGMKGAEKNSVMSRIGALIENPGLYPNMTAEENLKVKCCALGIRDKNLPAELLELVGLSDTGKKAARKFSLGMKQRLAMAIALTGNPDILLLDEPTNGLDPQGIAEIRETILRLNREKNITFIISSHILDELSKIATHYGIIHKGELIEQLTREELSAKCSEHIELKTDSNQLACTVLDEMGIADYTAVDSETLHVFANSDLCGDISLRLAQKGIKVKEIAVKSEALEEYYLKLTGGNENA